MSEGGSAVNSPVTLGDLVRNDKLLWVYCCACGHERDVNPATVPLPVATPVPEVGKHMSGKAHGALSLRLAEDQHQARVVPRRCRSHAPRASLSIRIFRPLCLFSSSIRCTLSPLAGAQLVIEAEHVTRDCHA